MRTSVGGRYCLWVAQRKYEYVRAPLCHPFVILIFTVCHHTVFGMIKLKRRAIALPLLALFSALLRGAVSFGINIIVDAVSSLNLLVHIRTATVLTHSVFVHLVFGHPLMVH